MGLDGGLLIGNQMNCLRTHTTPGRRTVGNGAHSAVGTGAPIRSRLGGIGQLGRVLREGDAVSRLKVGAPGWAHHGAAPGRQGRSDIAADWKVRAPGEGLLLDRGSNRALLSEA
jgi:hypothetical protein